MKISSINIHNWRSIENLSLKFENLMIFIGQNNHGKSNVLSAILFFFGEVSLNITDYRKGTNELWVELEFVDLDEHDQTQFKKYLTTSKSIKVRRTANSENGVSYNGYTQIPKNILLSESILSDYTNREKAQELPYYSLLPSSGRITKTLLSEALTSYLINNASTIEFEYKLEESGFLGAKNIAQGIFGTVIFVPALKNTLDELSTKGSSTFSKLLSKVITEMSENNDKYKEARDKIKDLTKILNKQKDDGNYNEERPKELTSLEEKIESQLITWNTKIDIEIFPPNIDEIFKLGTQVWIDDGVKTDISHKGHGLQRSILFALIRSWVDVSQAIKKTEESDEDLGRRSSKSTFFVLEEPELYLHPQAQREFFQVLKTLAEGENQIVLSTHSSYFIDLALYKSICIVKKESSTSPTVCFQCSDDLLEMVEEKKAFNLTYWINPDRGELFFSEKTILVEGQSEKTIIPFLASRIGVFKHSYTIVDCGSKTNIPLYIHLLNKFKLPYVVVYDKDHQEGKNSQAIQSADIATNAITESIDTSLGISIELINDIEEEIGITDKRAHGKPFEALEHITHKSYLISEALKNKIITIYK
ncbi:MAG: AAA family ATPase [Candidatus Dojkabacteria bacterium]|nr:MAG: AAA family ATPase [Candidatus Dojkabacteria bacterium]